MKIFIYHLLHTVCCSEARGLNLGCWEHIILLRITDLIQHVNMVSISESEQCLEVSMTKRRPAHKKKKKK